MHWKLKDLGIFPISVRPPQVHGEYASCFAHNDFVFPETVLSSYTDKQANFYKHLLKRKLWSGEHRKHLYNFTFFSKYHSHYPPKKPTHPIKQPKPSPVF